MQPLPLTAGPLPCAPVAQLDRAPDFESVGRRFESCRAYHPMVSELDGLLPEADYKLRMGKPGADAFEGAERRKKQP